MWAIRRRIYIVLILLGAFLLLVVFPYWYTHREIPTCSDGKQNQSEIGIDCGGGCALVCKGGAKDLTILWTKVFPVRAGVYDLVAYFENPNFEIGVPRLPYVARLYDAAGGVIAETQGETFAGPTERFAIFVGNLRTGDKMPVKGEIEVPADVRWFSARRSENLFSVSEKVLVGADSRPKLSAVLHNETPEIFREIEIVAVIYDKFNQPVGVSSTKVEKIAENGTEKIFFTWTGPLNFVAETEACEAPVDVVLALDRSGSMKAERKLEDAKRAAAQFVDRLTREDQGAYVSFASEASLPIDQGLTDEIARLKRSIDKTVIGAGGIQYTNIGAAIRRAIEELASFRHNEEANPVLVLLTDGIPTRPEDPKNKNYPAEYSLSSADAAKKEGIAIYTIGLGSDLDAQLLEKIATAPEYFYRAASGAELAGIYQEIATAICKRGPSVIEIIPRVNNMSLVGQQ